MTISYCGLDIGNPTTPFFCKEMRPGETEVACGRCRIAHCCQAHGHSTCAECDDFPCAEMLQFSFCPQSGDGGVRVEALRQLAGQK